MRWSVLILTVLLFCGCGATHGLYPLKKNESQVYASVGGPILEDGGVPVPFMALGYAYGLNPRVTLHGETNITAAIYKTAVLGGGGLLGIMEQRGFWPRLAADVQGFLATDIDSTVFLPTTALIASYPQPNQKVTPFFGFDLLYQFYDMSTPPLPEIYLTLFLGVDWQINSQWGLAFELRWAGLNHENTQETLEFVQPGFDYGLLAPTISVRFGVPGGSRPGGSDT